MPALSHSHMPPPEAPLSPPQTPPGSSRTIWDLVGVPLGWDSGPTNVKPMNVKQEVEAWLKRVNGEPVPQMTYSTINHQRELECGRIEVPTAREFVARAAQAIIAAAGNQHLILLQIGPVPATSLPEAVGRLPLRILEITETACTALPFLDKLTGLEHLSLRHHPRLASLPQALGRLGQLKHLTIANCEQLRSLPPLGGMRNLQSLTVEACPQLEKLPADLGRLTNLRSLDLRGCDGLTDLPESLRKLPQECVVHAPAGLQDALAELRASQSGRVGWFG